MAEVRYKLPGVPPGPAAGLTAFLPSYAYPGGSGQSYKYAVLGFPGTRGIPVSPVVPPGGGDVSGQASMGTARTVNAPPAFWPNQYYQAFIAERPGAGMPILLPSWTTPGPNTVLPVPATDLRTTYLGGSARLSRKTILQRVRQLPWFPRLYQAPNA